MRHDFTKANPDIKVKITQRGWDDYWSTLTNGFVAGTAPDVFTNHLRSYPELAAKKQLLAIDEAVEKDNVDLAPTTRASPTSGWARTASATVCPRTGTPSPCSTTRP